MSSIAPVVCIQKAKAKVGQSRSHKQCSTKCSNRPCVVVKLAGAGHSGSVVDKPESGARRREEIGQRLAAIRTWMDVLKAARQDDASPAAVSERIASAQRQTAASQAAAERAIDASIRAFRRAAQAHEHAASSMNEPQQPGSVTRTSTSGKQQATGQLPQQTHSGR